jgi:hypothetical protein
LAFYCSSSIEVPIHLRYGELPHRERYIVVLVVLVLALVVLVDAAAAY